MTEGENQERSEKDLERMTVKELRAIATEETDLAGIHAMKKAELVAALKEAKGIADQATPKEKAPKKPAQKEELTSKELKDKISELKVKKEEFRKIRDRRMVEVLRRRINRAKKKTRRLGQS